MAKAVAVSPELSQEFIRDPQKQTQLAKLVETANRHISVIKSAPGREHLAPLRIGMVIKLLRRCIRSLFTAIQDQALGIQGQKLRTKQTWYSDGARLCSLEGKCYTWQPRMPLRFSRLTMTYDLEPDEKYAGAHRIKFATSFTKYQDDLPDMFRPLLRAYAPLLHQIGMALQCCYELQCARPVMIHYPPEVCLTKIIVPGLVSTP